jgi:hypothetical protein
MCSPVTASQMAGFGPLVAQLSDLAAALAHGVDSGAWAGLPVAAAPAVLAELLAARDVIGDVASAGVSGVHAGGALPGGHVSTKQWLQHAAGLSAMSAGAELARAAALRDSFPETRVAALAGDLSQDKVRAITTGLQAAVGVLEPAARAAAITTVEHSLVDYARTATVEQVRRKVARLRFTLDPDGADARAMAAHDEQHLRFTPVGDGVAVDAWLTGETAAAVQSCLDQTVDTWFRSPAALAPHATASRAPAAVDRRLPATVRGRCAGARPGSTSTRSPSVSSRPSCSAAARPAASTGCARTSR